MFSSNDNKIFNQFLSENSSVKTVESDFDYNSFYRAYVVSISDPQHLGRIKIRIPALHGSSDSSAVWAYPACFVGLGNQVGQFILPAIGSIVFVTFEYSDEHRPIYFGGIPTIFAEGKEQSYGMAVNGGLAKEVTEDDIPTEYKGTQAIIYKAPTGAVMYFDSNDLANKIIIKDSHDQAFKLVSVTDMNSGDITRFAEMRSGKDTYLRLNEDELKLIIHGEEVDLAGGGTTQSVVASTTKSGMVSTAEQTFAGTKTFQDGIIIGTGTNAGDVWIKPGEGIFVYNGSDWISQTTITES